MKISCTHANLATALQYLEWVVGRQSHLPILSNILFEAEQGRLRLLATNLEIGVIAVVGSKVEREGRAVLPAKILSQFIQNTDSNEVIHIELEGNRVVVQNGRDEVKVNVVESKDFPLIPEFTGEYKVRFPQKVITDGLKKVLFAVSTNESRLELTGIYMSASERGVHLTATDSFRLSEVTLVVSELNSEISALAEFLKEIGGVILPKDTLQELSRIGVDEDSVAIAIQDNQVFFEVAGVKIVSRIIQGRYPEYQQIIPKEFQLTVMVARDDLIRALKMAAGFAQYGSSEVEFWFSAENGSITLTTVSSGVGEQQAVVVAEEGITEDRRIIFQPRHLLEGVAALEGSRVSFHLNTKDMPVLLTGEGPHLYLVMPIRK